MTHLLALIVYTLHDIIGAVILTCLGLILLVLWLSAYVARWWYSLKDWMKSNRHNGA